MATAAEELAGFTAGLRVEDIPLAVRENAALRVLSAALESAVLGLDRLLDLRSLLAPCRVDANDPSPSGGRG